MADNGSSSELTVVRFLLVLDNIEKLNLLKLNEYELKRVVKIIDKCLRFTNIDRRDFNWLNNLINYKGKVCLSQFKLNIKE